MPTAKLPTEPTAVAPDGPPTREPPAAQGADDVSTPLVVNADALTGDGLLVEGAARLVARFPLKLFALAIWLLRGRAVLARRVAEAVPLPPSTLALDPAVRGEIDAARAAGREVWLASDAHRDAVKPLAEAVGAAGCVAADGPVGSAGEARAADLAARFGPQGFDYLGRARRDLAVWGCARRAVGAGLSAGLARDVRAIHPAARLLPASGGAAVDYLRALRPHHWMKNLLVFVPLLADHETDAGLYLRVLGLFAALSACASGTYLLNDVLDLPHDRRHGRKRGRPLAAGRTRLLPSVGLGLALAAGGLAAAFRLSAPAGYGVALYLAATLAYSLWLKRRTFVDVLVIGALYALRVLTGAAAVSVVPSPWLLAFSLFAFLAVAIAKRQTELAAGEGGHGRAYRPEDGPAMAALGAGSGFATVVVLTLYIQSPAVSAGYARPELLWLVCPLLVHWLGRLTLLAGRGEMDDDPLVFALRDPTSWVTVFAIGAIGVAAL